jgi:uncharacterized membrane protein (UPF0182 family)
MCDITVELPKIILQVILSTLVSIALYQSVRMLLRRYNHATFSALMFLAVEIFYGSGISRVFVGESLSSQIHRATVARVG